MSNTRTSAYTDALLAIARAEESTHTLEDELYRVARAFESSDELRTTLSDPHIPAGRRQQIVEDLLGGASPSTLAVVSMIVAAGRSNDLPKIVDEFIARSTGDRGQVIAEVRSAVALTEDQQSRLAAALSAAANRDITIRNVVDPTVLGGVVTTIGDSVIDGSVRSRLAKLRDSF